MLYKVNRIFKSIQGEGLLTGIPCVFIRFGECNMNCNFCDTDFKQFTLMSADEIVKTVLSFELPHVVFTGGEPLLFDLFILIQKLSSIDRWFHLETNGTIFCEYVTMFDYISLSPKVGVKNIKLDYCDCLKILYPYINKEITADNFKDFPTSARVLQPINNKVSKEIINELYRLKRWQLGLQIHKIIGVE